MYFEQKSVTVPTGGETVVKANVTIPKNTENNTLGITSYTSLQNTEFKLPERGSIGTLGREISYERYTDEDKKENGNMLTKTEPSGAVL